MGTTQATGVDRRWLKRFGRAEPSATRLLCFHYAGASAALFRHWPQLLSASTEPLAVQLPGRADRFGEPPFERMTPLVDELIGALTPVLGQPYACYGVSMGARVAWALAHALRERALPGPRVIYVAASAAPRLDDGNWPWENRSDGLEGYVREMGGTPEVVLNEPDLLAGLLPTLAADLTVLSTHGFHPGTPLDVPIHAFAGIDDNEAGPARMDGWRAETTARFGIDALPCGHFFDADGERRVAATIGHDLQH